MYGASLGIFNVHVQQLRHIYHSASDSSKCDHPRHSYDVISSIQDGGNGVAILLPVFVSWVPSFVKVEVYLHTKFRWNNSIYGWDITTSGFWKQTSAKLEFYFRFRFLRLHHHRHVILHMPTKFRPNRIIGDRVMTSYVFFKMAARASQFYFRFRFSWVFSFEKSKSTRIINFGEISQSTAEITTSGFWKETSAMPLEFYFRFRFLRLCHHRHVILHLPTKCRPNRTIGDRVFSLIKTQICNTPFATFPEYRFNSRTLVFGQKPRESRKSIYNTRYN